MGLRRPVRSDEKGGLRLSEFLNMGGYGGYVWPAYAVSAAAILGLAFVIWRRGRRLRKRLTEASAAREPNSGA